MRNFDWPFGTLPFGLFGSHLDTMGLCLHILGPILVIFDICHFLTIPGLFEYFSENGCPQRIKVFSIKERSFKGVRNLVLGGQVPRLNYGPIFFPV